MNKNFMYGIGAVKYKDFTIGYIEKNSFDLGGKKPEAAKIEAEQVQGAPVLVIPQSNGGIAPTFNVIQMNYSNLHKLLGGSLHYKKEDSEKKNSDRLDSPVGGACHAGTMGTLPRVRTERTDSQRHAAFQSCRQADPYRNLQDRGYARSGDAGGRFAALRRVRYGSNTGRVGGSTSCRRRKPRLQHRSKVRRANVWLTVWNN